MNGWKEVETRIRLLRLKDHESRNVGSIPQCAALETIQVIQSRNDS